MTTDKALTLQPGDRIVWAGHAGATVLKPERAGFVRFLWDKRRREDGAPVIGDERVESMQDYVPEITPDAYDADAERKFRGRRR